MDKGRGSARIMPLKPLGNTPSTRDLKGRLESIGAESASVSGTESRLRKAPALAKMRSQRLKQDSTSSVTKAPLTPAQKRWRKYQENMLKFMDSRHMSIFMAIITLYALFGDDIRLSAAPVSADIVFYNLSFAVLIIYTIEFMVNCLAKPLYIGSFYFWLDLVSTASLIVDVGW